MRKPAHKAETAQSDPGVARYSAITWTQAYSFRSDRV